MGTESLSQHRYGKQFWKFFTLLIKVFLVWDCGQLRAYIGLGSGRIFKEQEISVKHAQPLRHLKLSWPGIFKGDTGEDVTNFLARVSESYGVPVTCTTDGGPNFVSDSVRKFMTAYGIQHRV